MKEHPQAETPRIDRLAARGVLFANAHCAAPACNPSRAAVFCGRMPHVTGVWANKKGQSLDRLYPKALLLPTTFSRSGYQTLGTRKLLHSGGNCLPNVNAKQVSERVEPLVRILHKARPATPIVLVEDRSYTDAFLLEAKRQRNVESRKALKKPPTKSFVPMASSTCTIYAASNAR